MRLRTHTHKRSHTYTHTQTHSYTHVGLLGGKTFVGARQGILSYLPKTTFSAKSYLPPSYVAENSGGSDFVSDEPRCQQQGNVGCTHEKAALNCCAALLHTCTCNGECKTVWCVEYCKVLHQKSKVHQTCHMFPHS